MIIMCIQIPEIEVHSLFEGKLNTKVDIRKMVKLNEGKKKELIIVVMPNWEQKQKIMAAKIKLRNTDIYIDNDLTWKER